MDKQLWGQLEVLFEKVISLPRSQWPSFIDHATQNNDPLRRELTSLLKHHEERTSTVPGSESALDLRQAIEKVVNQFEADISVRDSAELDPENKQPDKAHALAGRLQSGNPDLEICDVISHGGMGTVFRAFQKTLQREVAVKVLHVAVVDKRIRKRFVRESRSAAAVASDHVVEIFSVHDDAELPYLVMELIAGPSARALIQISGPLNPLLAADIAFQIANGLQACHDQQLIHRDVKPANIMLEKRTSIATETDRYRAKLIDFGIAQDLSDTEQTVEKSNAGTPAYMSPEQVLTPDAIDHRSDVYGLGASLYQMLVGEPPFRGSFHMILKKIGNTDPTPPRQLDDRVPRDLESICLKALNTEPMRRYDSARAMANDLQNFIEGKPTIARPISKVEKLQKWCSRNRRLAAMTVAAVSFLLMLTLGSIVFSLTLLAKNREIARQQFVNTQTRVLAVLDSDPGALQSTIQPLLPLEQPVVDLLHSEFDTQVNSFNRRLNAAVALSYADPGAAEFLIDYLDDLFESPAICANVLTALEHHPDAARLLVGSLDRATDTSAAARRIILLAQLGHFSQWEKAANPTANPELGTEIIHGFASWHANISDFLRHLEKQHDQSWFWAPCQAISLIDKRSLKQGAVDDVANFLRELYSKSPHCAVRASAEAALKKWAIPVDDVNPESTNTWKILSNGMRLVRIEAGTAKLGRLDPMSRFQGFPPHEVVISNPFFIADAETTVGQFREYLLTSGPSHDDQQTPKNVWPFNSDVSVTDQHPAQMVSWIDAVKFCNWLSVSQGLTPAYRLDEKPLKLNAQGQEVEIGNWVLIANANGFRLPTEAEWEFACRCFSQTIYHYGDDSERFKHYGLGSQFTSLPAAPVRSRLPNAFGLFDMHGNVWEWCHDWYSDLTNEPLVDPFGPAESVPGNGIARVYRGGGVGTFSGRIDSESRGQAAPNVTYDNLGFRVVLPATNEGR